LSSLQQQILSPIDGRCIAKFFDGVERFCTAGPARPPTQGQLDRSLLPPQPNVFFVVAEVIVLKIWWSEEPSC
jgi:hypothetical protein